MKTVYASSIYILATQCLHTWAAAPEMSNVWPDFPDAGTSHVITGEGLDAKHTEVWAWRSPEGDPNEQELPALPLRETGRVRTLDVARQVIVTDPRRGSVLWVKTPSGVSKSYLALMARRLD